MIHCQVLTGNLSDDPDDKNPKIQAEALRLSPALKASYLNYLDVFRKKETTPTLAYIGDEEIKSAAEQYLADFINEFAQVKERMTLSLEQQNALLLGMLIAGNNAEEILLTPFHPLNVAYQLFLLNENDIEHASDVVVDRLNSIYLLPYIQRKRTVYKVSDQTYSLEWKYYAPVKNRKYMGGRRYVAKLVEDKVEEFTSHFRYIFDEINNRVIKINLINMGDCSEILQGIAQYYCHAVKRTPDVEKLLKFEIRVYSNETLDNSLNFLKNRIELKRFLDDQRLSIDSGTAMNDLEGIIARKILKEGREFGVGTILSTQFLKHFETGEDNYAKYILTWVVHCVADFNPSDVDFVFNTEPKSKEEQQLFNDIKQLKMHNSIARIGISKPIYLEDLPFWKLMKGEE